MSENAVLQLETRPRCSENRHVHSEMAENTGLRFPPFCLIGRCLAKIRQEQATLVLVTPTWQTQPWYMELLQMLKEEPILIPYMEGILTSPRGEQHPLLQASRMNLAAWKVSGLVQMQAKFKNRLETFSTKTSGTAQNPLTRPPVVNGLAGVVRSKLIQFRPLWNI